MDMKFEPRIWDTSLTTGTGAMTAVGVPAYESSLRPLSDAYSSVNVKLLYLIRHQSLSTNEWELGMGHYASGVLTRLKVFKSSNSDSLVSFSIGLKDMFVLGWPTFSPVHVVANDTTLDFSHGTVVVDAAVARVITLPDASDFIGKRYTIIRVGSATATVTASGSDTLSSPITSSGPTSIVLGRQYSAITVVSDGTSKWIIESITDTPFNLLAPILQSEVAITAATTLTSATFGRMHLISGTSANYTITLPAVSGNAGQIIGFRVAPMANANRIYTLDGNSAETIDGQTTRLLWANEVAILYCTGSEWTKIGGLTLPMACIMRRTTAQSISNATWTQIATTTVVTDNTSSLSVPLSDTTNGRARIIRPGIYFAAGFASINLITAGSEFNGGVGKNSGTPADNPNAFTTVSVPASTFAHATGSGYFNCAAADWLGTLCYHNHGSARDTRAVSTVYPSLSVIEIPGW